MKFPPWRRAATLAHRAVSACPARFDTASAVLISGSEDLAALEPAFSRSLSSVFEAEALAGRLCPVLLADQTVAIFALAEHVGSDQADELARRVVQAGYVLAWPSRYVLATPLLLAIARNQVTAQSLSGQQVVRLAQTRTALADAFQDMIEWGVRNGASDLHLNVRLDQPESEVKYTLSGSYVAPERFSRMPTSMLVDILSVAWMDIRGGNGAVFDPLAEQQGSLARRVDGKDVLLRWASLAADQGPSVCLRLLVRDISGRTVSLEHLGYLPAQVDIIERAMLSQGGAVVFAGTVGSGKSTTLATLIAALPAHRKVVTIEDPVEYLIPGAIQNTVARNLDVAAHGGYAAKLRALKRSAMNDVLLGEIRDEETGRAFMDLAGSGVNVYTTVHAPSAALIPDRLASDFIGVSRDFLATPGLLKLQVYQALLPVLCDHCALPVARLLQGATAADGQYRPAEYWRSWLARIRALYACSTDTLRIRNPEGCPECRRTHLKALAGYAGRTVVAECIEPALTTIHQSAMDCGVQKSLWGQIDPRDIEPRFQSFETVELTRTHRASTGSPTHESGPLPRLRAVP